MLLDVWERYCYVLTRPRTTGRMLYALRYLWSYEHIQSLELHIEHLAPTMLHRCFDFSAE
jgi:hypothetical protein